MLQQSSEQMLPAVLMACQSDSLSDSELEQVAQVYEQAKAGFWKLGRERKSTPRTLPKDDRLSGLEAAVLISVHSIGAKHPAREPPSPKLAGPLTLASAITVGILDKVAMALVRDHALGRSNRAEGRQGVLGGV